jgi:hypothetical protein
MTAAIRTVCARLHLPFYLPTAPQTDLSIFAHFINEEVGLMQGRGVMWLSPFLGTTTNTVKLSWTFLF